MKKIYLLFLFFTIVKNSFSQTTVFSDDFSTNTSATWTTTGAIGASSWNVLVSGVDWGARRNTSPLQLELTNDVGVTTNAIGSALASTSMSSFSSPYNTTLNLNTGTVTWNFNIRQIRADPSGMSSGNYAAAFILSGTSNTTRTIGTGYAITYGQSGTADPVRLIEYTTGLAISTNIITSNTTGLIDFGAEYLSVRVIYTPSTNTWELFLRNDGVSAFADPATGTLVSQGTAINSTYTATPLTLMGGFWNGATGASQPAFFDNTTVIVGTAAGSTVSIVAGSNATEGGSNGNFTINFSTATTAITTFDYVLPVSGNATFTTDYGANLTSSPTAGVTPASLSATSGTITVPSGVSSVTVTIVPVDDALSEGSESVVMTISNPSSPYTIGTASATIIIIDNEPTAIHTIQGSGMAAIAGTYTTSGIVTGIYPTFSPAGFYIEEPDATWDADPNTSEGIFVVSNAAVAVGHNITVTGIVQENAASPSFNQAVFATVTSVTVNSTGNALPTAVNITLPVTAITDYEKYEAMIVRFPGTLTVSDNDRLGSFGEVKLSANGIVYQPTQVVDPNDNPPGGTTSTGSSNVPAVTAYSLSNTLRTILLDDGRGGTMPSLPYVNVDNTLRVGSTIDNISGILGYAFNQYRIQPTPSFSSIVFNHAVRPAVPGYGAANLKVVSLNVLNYFNGTNGAAGSFPTTRGAHSLVEFNRQREKIINAIVQMNADVLGLIEMENLDLNDATPGLLDLVNGLNAAIGAGTTYSIIDDDLDNSGGQDNNTDQIRCAIIYKSSVVTPVGAAMLNNNGPTNRPNLAQTFNLNATNKIFNFIVNHFKSKGGTGTGLDADQGDGQAAFNETRRQLANNLITFINGTVIPTSGTNRIISVGDYNAYFEEDPMDILRAANYNVLGSSATYSFLFSGQLGSLDHAVISPSLAGTVTAFAKWNANSVEPEYLDYNDGVNDGGSDVVNPWAFTYTVSPWRSGDHDAIVMGLFLDAVLPVSLVNFSATKENVITKINWTTSQEINSREFIVDRSVNGGMTWQTIGTIAAAGTSASNTNYIMYDRNPAKGSNLYRLKSVDIDSKFSYSATRRVNFDSKYTFSVYPNPAADMLQINVDNATGFNARVQILNQQGQILINKQINSGNQPAQVNVSSLVAGMYFIKIITADGIVNMEKFTKQ